MSDKSNKKKSGAKLLWVVTLLVIVVGALGTVAYFISKNYHQLEGFNEALTAFNQEDWELAEKRLAQAISEDPNNEEIVSKFAIVNEQLGNWTEAGILWSRAAELNAFNSDDVDQSLNAFLRAGRIEFLRLKLAPLQPFQSDRQRLLMAFVHAQTGEFEDARSLIEQVADPAALSTPLGQFVSIISDESTAITPSKSAQLEALAESEDAAIANYALYTLANDAIQKREMARAEAYLKRRIPLNPKLGQMSLANVYYIQGKSEEAAQLYRQLIEELTPIEAIRFAEVLTALKSTTELQSLAKHYRVGSRATILAGYYMDALLAYEAGDATTVAAKVEAMGNELPITPVSQLLTFYDAIQRKDTKKVIGLLTEFPYDANERLDTYVTLLRPLLIELMAENDFIAAARIAELLQLRGVNDATLTLAVIGNAAQKQLLSRIDLEQALQTYPQEPKLWSIAADFYLRNADFQAAQNAAQSLLNLVPGNISAQLQNISALESQQQITAAAAAFTALYDENPTELRVLMQYLAFCTRNQLNDHLNALITSLQSNPAAMPGMRLLAEAELANLQRDADAVHHLLMQVVNDPQLTVSPDNAAMLYRVANLLATYDDELPAINLYQKLLPLTPTAVPILANLSELYAAQAMENEDSVALQQALNYAKQAYTADPSSPVARECYALRLYESGSYDDAQKLLFDFIQAGSTSTRIRTAWRGSMEHLIQNLAVKGEIYNRSNLCKLVLNEFPENKIALENLQSIKAKADLQAAERKNQSEGSE
jgi:tetratricopeptide (TPR) repeat protein